MTRYILIDVEVALEGNGTPFSSRMTEFGCVDLQSGAEFEGILYKATPHPDNPALSFIDESAPDLIGDSGRRKVLEKFEKWLNQFSHQEQRKFTFMSDNPAFDLTFFNYTWDQYMGTRSPAGHSARRIGDFWAGASYATGIGTWKNTSKWKSLRKTKHSHRAVEDSRGNREAFLAILEMFGDEDGSAF